MKCKFIVYRRKVLDDGVLREIEGIFPFEKSFNNKVLLFAISVWLENPTWRTMVMDQDGDLVWSLSGFLPPHLIAA